MDFNNLAKEEKIKLVEALEARKQLVRYQKLKSVFPEKGPFRRELYKKSLDFFTKGKYHRFRALMGGNRSGKSLTGITEGIYHWTGLYEDWWPGLKQKNPKVWLIVCESNALWMQSLQQTIFGMSGDDIGTGLLPLAAKNNGVGLVEWSGLSGCTGGIGHFKVRHVKGHIVNVFVKTYEMTREQFQAINADGIIFDEEPPQFIWTESLTRLMGTGNKQPGIAMLLFTPLKQLSYVVQQFLPKGKILEINPENPNFATTFIGWDDVPHLTEEDKEQLKSIYPQNELRARTEGIPGSGVNSVFPIDEKFITCDPFVIPSHWPRAFGMDFGWDPTSAIWIAKDPTTKIYYVYAEYKRGKQPAVVHAAAIKNRGEWIPGLCDPSRGLINYNDGSHQMDEYMQLGLNLREADSGVLSGISKILSALETGSLKIFRTCTNLLDEMRLLVWDKDNPNKIASKQEDHLVDSLKYNFSTFDYVAISENDALAKENDFIPDLHLGRQSGRNFLTGY